MRVFFQIVSKSAGADNSKNMLSPLRWEKQTKRINHELLQQLSSIFHSRHPQTSFVTRNHLTTAARCLRTPCARVLPSCSLSSETSDDTRTNDFIFQPSPYSEHRRKKQVGVTLNNFTSHDKSSIPPHDKTADTSRDLSIPKFSDHASLMNAIESLSGDPLEDEGGRIVTFRGSPTARLIIVGEAPGEQEDIQGVPFVGRSGQLLDKIFRYGGFDLQKQLYVTNVVKRRPQKNRTPTFDEMSFYLPYLLEEFRLIKPHMVILAGAVSARALLGKDTKISSVRGQWFANVHGVPLMMPIFHPSFLLRKPNMKADMVTDIHAIREQYMEAFPEDTLNDLINTNKDTN